MFMPNLYIWEMALSEFYAPFTTIKYVDRYLFKIFLILPQPSEWAS